MRSIIPKEKISVWVCPECGGTNVQEQRWVDANTRELFGSCDENSFWCEDCEDHSNHLKLVEVPKDEFENIAKNQPVFPGDTLSHQGAKVLAQAELTKRNENGDHVLTEKGKQLWALWKEIPDDDSAV